MDKGYTQVECLLPELSSRRIYRAHVFIADRDIQSANDFAAEMNKDHQVIWTAQVDVSKWDQQAAAFKKAVETFGRIDYVFPVAGISERKAFPNRGECLKDFEEPDLSVLDINLKAVLYTVSLALQQFRRQKVNRFGFRGKSKSRVSLMIQPQSGRGSSR